MVLGDHDNDNRSLDKDLQEQLMVEQQRAQFQMQVHRLTETCWDKCVEKPSSRLDGRTETCISNCVERFIDTSLAITKRFARMLQKAEGMDS